MPSLIELKAKFMRVEDRPDGRVFAPALSIAEAHGVRFLCPKCFVANGGAVGTHQVICWSETSGAPADVAPGPGRWRMVGTSIEDLTLDCEPGRTRSVQLNGGCDWHGFVTNGAAE